MPCNRERCPVQDRRVHAPQATHARLWLGAGLHCHVSMRAMCGTPLAVKRGEMEHG